MSAEWGATYRLQLHKDFPLDAAARILPYLSALGISHVYLSPCLQATPGSQHGYDVTDPSRISDDLGGEPAWRRFVAGVRAQSLKILLDVVPNHMAASHFNPWWDDVLAHGPFSEFAEYFDIRIPAHAEFRVQLCSLARAYGEALEKGELQVALFNGVPRVTHYEHSWPLGLSSWQTLLEDAGDTAGPTEPAPMPMVRSREAAAAASAHYRQRAAAARVLLAEAEVSGRLGTVVARINQDAGRLDMLLQQQFYVLHSWKLAGELTNYRRFFDVGSLVGIRTERPEVLAATHARVQSMISRKEIDGLRIDHPDGLRDPLSYFQSLREFLPDGRIYVEKILDNDERLMSDWPIDGTVGYDFLAKVNRLWMDDQRVDALTATYSDFTGHSVNFAALVRQKKRAIIDSTFSANLEELAKAAIRSARARWLTRDISPQQLREALIRVTVAMPVYRTYRTAGVLHEEDRKIMAEAVQSARISSIDVDAAAFDFLLMLFTKPELSEAEAEFVAQWQQLAPAVMAKGVEDTTFYCFDRLVSCNEVGAQASLVGISADKFHEFCHNLSDRWPHNMLATSTHDNKRAEDVRTRISVLSEIPDRWSEALHRWSQLNTPAWRNRTPDRHAEYLLYQTLIGAWPIDQGRCWQYMLKACREAKIRTSWQEPNGGYEENMRGFIDGVFHNPEFIASLTAFVEPLILPGRINSLAQTLIKMVVPGVPDFYQGTELWDLSLVDPDNRRPVDYETRAGLVRRCGTSTASDALDDWNSGLPKLWMISRLLTLRRQRPDIFSEQGKYQPLVAQGAHLGNLLAFRRGENLIAVVPRFTMSVQGRWEDTSLPLPRGVWRNYFTDALHDAAAAPPALFESFPVALLLKDES